ncbi:MAG: NAD(+) synthetase, partial [Candidatus Brockarchaeota archaeon]|nr:NAD(+) synthetase [Candidatus Brockarchaeota archaeon]
MPLGRDVLNIDAQAMEQRIRSFVKNAVSESKTKGLVLGLSGGVDSCVAALLCAKAIRSDDVLALLLPTSS